MLFPSKSLPWCFAALAFACSVPAQAQLLGGWLSSPDGESSYARGEHDRAVYAPADSDDGWFQRLRASLLGEDTLGDLYVMPFSHHGAERTVRIFVPAAARHTPPEFLLLGFHGRTGTGASLVSNSDLAEALNQANGIGVFPDGYARSWADGRPGTDAQNAGIDDVNFLLALHDWLVAEYPFASGASLVAGMSNGGFMALRMYCEAADRFEAFGIVAATMPVMLGDTCLPPGPAAVRVWMGTADPTVDYEGSSSAADPAKALMSAAGTLTRLSSLGGCQAAPQPGETVDAVDDGTAIRVFADEACSASLVEVIDGGHTWPGGAALQGGTVSREAGAGMDLIALYLALVDRAD